MYMMPMGVVGGVAYLVRSLRPARARDAAKGQAALKQGASG
jgi:hypothetical protein